MTDTAPPVSRNGPLGWRRALVYGLGVSGLAATRLLRSRGIEVVGVDGRAAEALRLGRLGEDPGVELRLGEEPLELPPGIDGVVVSPGVPPQRPLLSVAERRSVPVLAEVELAFRFLDGEVIGVTGSNGKSTTTALTGLLLRRGGLEAEVCGNFGPPLASVVDGAPGRIFVVELSSFQLQGVRRFHPRAAALLNLSADHLDRHDSLESYREAKATIFRRQEEGDVAVVNADDPLVASLAVERARRRAFSLRQEVPDGCCLAGESVLEMVPGERPEVLFRCSDLRLEGRHNLENAMAAVLLARTYGIEASVVEETLREFRGLPHRLQRVAEAAGVVWFDDSKGTNVGATLRSLEGFEDASVHLILGGRGKGGDFAPLRPMVERKGRRVYLIGEAARELAATLEGAVELDEAGTLRRAVEKARSAARPGEVVLLSPACASFDQFESFVQRGRCFQQLVREAVAGDERMADGA